MTTQPLTTTDITEAVYRELVPAKTITVGKKYYYSAKVGGLCRHIKVTVIKGPYKKTFKDGRGKEYVTVHGIECRFREVQAGKLREIRKKCPNGKTQDTDMETHPMPFNTDMMQALIAGHKTRTMRPLKTQPPHGVQFDGYLMQDKGKKWEQFALFSAPDNTAPEGVTRIKAPYRGGDHLWVREAWAHDAPTLEDCRKNLEDAQGPSQHYGPYYRADGTHEDSDLHWRPPFLMPRWASRYTLKITDVTPVRVRNMTVANLIAEGFGTMIDGAMYAGKQEMQNLAASWDAMYAAKGFSWDSNPWVWALTFRLITQP